MASLDNRCALITGAGSGMGRSHALLFAERGARVIVHDVNADGVAETADGVRVRGAKVATIVQDIRDTAAFRAAIGAAEKQIGPIDILVNNAGVSGRNLSFEDIDEETFDRMFAVHVKGTFFAVQTVIPGMKQRRYGRIINISSTFGVAGGKRASHYGGAKGALLGFTKSWAREYAAFNITVNAVAPGFILTPMTQASNGAPEKLAQRITQIPIGRYGEPVDISYAVAWLASDEASYVTGQVLSPNGGEYIT